MELTSSPGLFTANDDPVDFNAVVAGTYTGGTQYDGLDGNDTVTLANDATEAAEAGYVVGTAFNAGAGNDTVNGGTLNDIINGDAGHDTLNGATGSDTLNGGDGDDTITVEDGGDDIDGGTGTDELVVASNLAAAINLDAGITEIGGLAGTIAGIENVTTGGGNDTVVADSADNVINTGSGNDLVSIASGNNTIDGGTGEDILVARNGSADVTANLDTGLGIGAVSIDGFGNSTVSNFNSVFTGDGDDNVTGNTAGNRLYVHAGDNTVFGGAGNDDIIVGDGSNTVDGGADSDVLRFSSLVITDLEVDLDAGTIIAASGTGTAMNVEHVTTNSGNDTIKGDENSNILDGGGGADTLFGGMGQDLLRGRGGNDVLNGNEGPDSIQGGDDDDLIIVDELDGDSIDGEAGIDMIQFRNSPGDVTVDLNLGTASSTAGGAITLVSIEDIDDQSGDTNITGSDENNLILARDGTDAIDALDGDDIIIINDGGDTIDGGLGVDELRFVASLEGFVNLDIGAYDIDGVAGTVSNVENATGGTGKDTLVGSAGDNVLDGGAGNDVIISGTGDDTIYGRAGSDFVSLSDLDGDSGDGGDDFDTIQFTTGMISVNLDLATGVATLVGGGGSGTFLNFEGAIIFGDGSATINGTTTANNISVSGTDNTVTLLDGNDNVDLFAGGNDVDGGAGTFDSVRFNTGLSAVTVDLSGATGFSIVGGLMGDVIGFEVIRTGAGNDILTGSTANDRFESGTGVDTVNTGDGDDNIFVSDGGDILNGGGFNDGVFVTTTEDIVANLALGTLNIGLDAVTTLTDIENLTGSTGNDTITGGDGDDTLVFNGSGVQATGGLGMDAFEFIDYNPGVGTQNALLFDVNVSEMDKIDLSDWMLGLTAAQIAAAATQGPSANDSNLSLHGGDLAMTIFGISTTNLMADADDLFII